MDQRRMYGDLAWTWRIFSAKENYVEEAEDFAALIREHSRLQPQTLLHLGCGAGHLDWTLQKHFAITAVDASPEMLELAQGLNPQVLYQRGDMRSVRLGQQFDAVIVADSIDYMLGEEDLRAAFQTAWVHLRPGGVFCTYAEITREHFQQNETRCSAHSHGHVDLAFFENNYDPDPADTTIQATFIYLIRRDGKLTIETDRHLCGIFAIQTWVELLQKVGFEVTVRELPDRPPMFAGLKTHGEEPEAAPGPVDRDEDGY